MIGHMDAKGKSHHMFAQSIDHNECNLGNEKAMTSSGLPNYELQGIDVKYVMWLAFLIRPPNLNGIWQGLLLTMDIIKPSIRMRLENMLKM